jgi:hypothetical protein
MGNTRYKCRAPFCNLHIVVEGRETFLLLLKTPHPMEKESQESQEKVTVAGSF